MPLAPGFLSAELKLLTSAGSINPLRQIYRVVQTVSGRHECWRHQGMESGGSGSRRRLPDACRAEHSGASR
jgi:hypothetical protein